MAEVIKKDTNAPAQPFRRKVSEWPVSKGEDNPDKYRRIIKAGEAFFSSESKKIPHVNIAPDSPVIKPIRKGIFVEGVEIICRCGEKIVVKFDLDENAELR